MSQPSPRQAEWMVEAYRNGGILAPGMHRGTRDNIVAKGWANWQFEKSAYVLTTEGWNVARKVVEKNRKVRR